MIKGKISSWS